MKKFLFVLISYAVAAQVYGATITFNALHPAPVDIPVDIQSIAIINRTIPQDKEANFLEGILTGEGLNGEGNAIQSALSGLRECLQESGRFQVIRTNEKLIGSGSGGQFPVPLEWELVRKLCTHYNVDAILALETYDSDYIITKGKKSGDALGFFAQGVTHVSMGIRLYNLVDHSIADQYHFSHTSEFQSTSGTLQEAVIGLMNKDQALSRVSYQAASEYAGRISPGWYRISRDYFKRSKGDEHLAMGARMMEANDWDEALKALSEAYEHGHRKTKGRAAHNLAVVHEILGNLEESKAWATTAWGKHGHKPSKDYGYWLTRRIQQQQFVDRQMATPDETEP